MQKLYYIEPQSITEVFQLLNTYGKKACVFAGGTDVIVNIRSNRVEPEIVIQLKKVAELNRDIEITDQGLKIGSLSTLSEVVKNGHINRWFPALAQAADSVGSVQIRNRATLAGNICNASPAADTAPVLMLYNSLVSILSEKGKRYVPVTEFFLGPRKTVLGQGEIVESIVLPVPQMKYGSAYLRMSRRKAVDLSSLGVGVLVGESGEVRIALGAVGPKPFRAYKAEMLLKGNLYDEKAVEYALNAVAEEAGPITDLRASKEYRLEMMKEYTRRALQKALNVERI